MVQYTENLGSRSKTYIEHRTYKYQRYERLEPESSFAPHHTRKQCPEIKRGLDLLAV